MAQVQVLVKELVQVQVQVLVLVLVLVLALALAQVLAAPHHFETLWNQNRRRKLQARQWLARKRIAVLIVVFC
jgi:hypothetical protein